MDWENWLNFLESDDIKKMVTKSRGDWMNYVKAPVLRLQYLYKTQKLRGMDIAFTGNIPIAAGLSSSSVSVKYARTWLSPLLEKSLIGDAYYPFVLSTD